MTEYASNSHPSKAKNNYDKTELDQSMPIATSLQQNGHSLMLSDNSKVESVDSLRAIDVKVSQIIGKYCEKEQSNVLTRGNLN